MIAGYKIDYQKFDNEIKELRNGLKEFKDNRKQFNIKIAQIIKTGGVPDKKYPPSSYWDDYESCLKSLKSVGVSDARSVEECSTKYKGEGTISGNTRQASLTTTEIPAWQITYDHVNNKSIYEEPQPSNNIRSASTSTEEPYHVTVMSNSPMNRSLSPIEQTESTNIKGGSLEDTRPSWMICYDHTNNKDMA